MPAVSLRRINQDADELMAGNLVNIKPLKEKAIALGDPFRTVILGEPGLMPMSEYLAKCNTWLRLMSVNVDSK